MIRKSFIAMCAITALALVGCSKVSTQAGAGQGSGSQNATTGTVATHSAAPTQSTGSPANSVSTNDTSNSGTTTAQATNAANDGHTGGTSSTSPGGGSSPTASEEKYDDSFNPPNIQGEQIVIETPRNLPAYRYGDKQSGIYVQVLGYKASHLPGNKTFIWAQLAFGNQGTQPATVDMTTAHVNFFVQIPWGDLPAAMRPAIGPKTDVMSMVAWPDGCAKYGIHVTNAPVMIVPGQSRTVTWGTVLNGAVASDTLKSNAVDLRLELNNGSTLVKGSLF